MHPVDWNRVPGFIKDAVQRFPFADKTEATEFLLLLTSRIRARLVSLPESFEVPLDTDCRATWSWNLYHEMLAGERFIGRCAVANWLVKIPDLYREVYNLTVTRSMLDRDRKAGLEDIAYLPSEPGTRYMSGFPWDGASDDELSTGSLDEALANYRRLNNDSGLACYTAPIAPELVLPLIKARENLTLASNGLGHMAESLKSQTKTGGFLGNVLTLMERRLGEEYGLQ